MKVKDVMSNKVVSVTPKTTYKAIWTAFFSHKINAVPVVDENKKLAGIIVKEDLLKSLYPDYLDLVNDFSQASDFEEMEDKIKDMADVRAEDIMNRHVIFTRTDSQAMRALSRMIAQRVNQLPVLTEKNEVVGMITKGDIFKGLFKSKVKYLKSAGKQKTVLVGV